MNFIKILPVHPNAPLAQRKGKSHSGVTDSLHKIGDNGQVVTGGIHPSKYKMKFYESLTDRQSSRKVNKREILPEKRDNQGISMCIRTDGQSPVFC